MAGKKEECQFCENFILENLKFSCEDCNLTLCETCNEKIHTKLPSLVEHKVTEIKIQACSNEESINLDKVLCFKHNENKCFAVCPNCCNCLCNLCLVRQNNQEKLHEIYEQKLKDMKDYNSKIEEDISYFSENLNKLKETKARGLEMYNETKKQILDKEEEMKDKVAEKAMALVKELDDWWLPQQDEITKEEERMDKAECDLRQRKTIMEDVVMSEKSEYVISAADRVMKDFPIKPAKKIEIQNLLKFSTKMSSKNLEVGLLLKIPKLEIVKSFESNQYEHLAKLNEDVYMGYMSPYIEHFVLTDKKCYKTNSFLIGYNMCDITLNTSGTLLFTTNSQIQTLDTKGNTTDFQSDINVNARGIHSKASIHGKYIIVGVVDNKNNKKSLFPGPTDSHRRILFLSMKGDVIKEIENDTNGKKLFCLPNVITTNINGDICVIDTMNEKKGRAG